LRRPFTLVSWDERCHGSRVDRDICDRRGKRHRRSASRPRAGWEPRYRTSRSRSTTSTRFTNERWLRDSGSSTVRRMSPGASGDSTCWQPEEHQQFPRPYDRQFYLHRCCRVNRSIRCLAGGQNMSLLQLYDPPARMADFDLIPGQRQKWHAFIVGWPTGRTRHA
jgi:hypothetical protein